MKKMNLLILIAVLLFSVVLMSCDEKEKEAAEATKVEEAEAEEAPTVVKKDGSAYTFGLAVGWVDNGFGLRIRNGWVDTIEKMGNADYIEAVGLSDVQKQISQVENFINIKVDAIFISTLDTTSMAPLIAKATKAGIPTFVVDSMIYDPSPTCTVQSDNFTLGVESMQFIVDRLNGEGNVVVFSAPQHEGIRNRTIGVYTVAGMNPGINIVARHDISWAVGDPTPLDAMQNILQAHPNKGDIDAVWAPYDTAAAQISNASEQAGRADEMFVTGVDGDDMAFVDYINAGTNFVATAAQTPYWMAKTTVEMAYKYLDGEKIPRHITAPYVLATKEKNVQPGYDMNM